MRMITITHAAWDFMMASMAGTIRSSILIIIGATGIIPMDTTEAITMDGMTHGICQVGMVGMAIPIIGDGAIPTIWVMAIAPIGTTLIGGIPIMVVEAMAVDIVQVLLITDLPIEVPLVL